MAFTVVAELSAIKTCMCNIISFCFNSFDQSQIDLQVNVIFRTADNLSVSDK